MRYPTLTQSKCAELAAKLASGADSAIEPHTLWIGHGDDLELTPIKGAANTITRDMLHWRDRDRDRFEGEASIRLYESLRHVPTEILDDRGFWRFLSLRYYWEFIAWREEDAFARGNYLKYVDASTNTESVLPRMYVRACAVGGNEHRSLASGIPNAGDFWRSHVVRVRTASAPVITRAFASKHARDRLTTDPLREAAKRLNRTWTNIVLHLYDRRDAEVLIDNIWDEVRGQ
jgi:hypothetical protein